MSKFLTIFKNKDIVKYFLTILGDNILKKADSYVHFISPSSKNLLKEISHNCNIYFETIRTPIDSFKFKYHDHDYNKCRLIDIDDEGCINDVSNELSKNNYLIDVICVAVHYSNRYGSDDYINKFCDNNNVINRVLYLKNNTAEDIVSLLLGIIFKK